MKIVFSFEPSRRNNDFSRPSEKKNEKCFSVCWGVDRPVNMVVGHTREKKKKDRFDLFFREDFSQEFFSFIWSMDFA